MQEDLSLAQQYVDTLEASKSEQSAELAAKAAEIADLQRRLHHDGTELQNTREENRRISERIIASDKAMVQLEAEVESSRQKATLAERERTTMQTSLDEALNEQSRMSRRLVEADNALTAATARLRQLETALTAAESDRGRLTEAIDEMKEKCQNEVNVQRMRFDALNARSSATERLLDEARQALTARADDIRSYERRIAEATLVRNMIEGKLGQIESGLAERDTQIRELEETRATLAERSAVLTKAATTRESAFNRAQERIGALEERIELLERELKGARESNDLQIEELNTQIHRERADRNMTEGALDAARQDVARLLREIAVLEKRPVPGEKLDFLPPAPNLRVV
jgi:chromosome segregation protein